MLSLESTTSWIGQPLTLILSPEWKVNQIQWLPLLWLESMNSWCGQPLTLLLSSKSKSQAKLMIAITLAIMHDFSMWTVSHFAIKFFSQNLQVQWFSLLWLESMISWFGQPITLRLSSKFKVNQIKWFPLPWLESMTSWFGRPLTLLVSSQVKVNQF